MGTISNMAVSYSGPKPDFGGIDLNHSRSDTPGALYNNSRISSGFYLDATGRLGYATGPLLSYVKGGYAYYDGGISYNTGVVATTKSVSGIGGWTLGGGIEYKVNPSWSLKAEYQLFQFEDIKLNPAAASTIKNDLTIDTFKFGVNYFVGRGYEPLK